MARPARKISILEIIEAVNGPMLNQLNLIEQSGKEKFSVKVEQVYDKAIAQSKNVFEKSRSTVALFFDRYRSKNACSGLWFRVYRLASGGWFMNYV